MAKTFNLADLFECVVNIVPEKEALVCNEQRRTFCQLMERSQRLARWFSQRGLGAGDNIGIYAHNCVEWVETYFAAFMIRAAPVNINYRYTAQECRYIIDNAELKAVLYHGQYEAVIAEAVRGIPNVLALLRVGESAGSLMESVEYESAISAGGPELGDVGRHDDDLVLLYTGGTTGLPKGVMWTHKALFLGPLGGAGRFSPDGPITAPEELAERVRASSQILLTQLPCAPLMHGAALWNTLLALFAGQKVVLLGSPNFDAEKILDLIDREKVGAVSIIGDAMALPLCEALEKHRDRWSLSSLFILISSSALFSDHLRDRLTALLPANVMLMNAMGSSESGQNGMGHKPATEGVICLQSDALNAVLIGGRLAKPGETGVLLRAGHLPLGYLKDPKKTADAFIELDGTRYVLVGDAARLEQDGTITVFGRDSQCINSGGEKIFSEEVEEAIRSGAGVRDAVVVGLDDARWGQKVVALVSIASDSGATTDRVKAHCRKRLAVYKIPKDVVFVEAIRRSPAGKPDYSWARRVAESALSSGS